MRKEVSAIYHALIKTPPLGVKTKTLREIKKLANRHKIPSLVFKTGSGRCGLTYAESGEQKAVQRFEQDLRGLTNRRQTFATIVPAMKAPIQEDRATRPSGERYVYVDGLAKFGTEMARRSLRDWWADIVKKGFLKDY